MRTLVRQKLLLFQSYRCNAVSSMASYTSSFDYLLGLSRFRRPGESRFNSFLGQRSSGIRPKWPDRTRRFVFMTSTIFLSTRICLLISPFIIHWSLVVPQNLFFSISPFPQFMIFESFLNLSHKFLSHWWLCCLIWQNKSLHVFSGYFPIPKHRIQLHCHHFIMIIFFLN